MKRLKRGNQLEAILALDPDFQLINSNNAASAAAVDLMIASGVVVLRISAYQSFAVTDRNLRQMAMLLGPEAKAQAEVVLAEMWRRLGAVETAVKDARKPRLLYLDVSSAAGGMTDEAITRAGARTSRPRPTTAPSSCPRSSRSASCPR